MQSPTPRPDAPPRELADLPAGEALEVDLRAPKREGRLPQAAANSQLKLLERRAQAAREAAQREASARREDSAARAARPAPSVATEVRRAETPVVHSNAAKPRITGLRQAQAALAVVALGSSGLLAVELVPAAVPVAVACVCLLASLYLTHAFTHPLARLADTARAVALGDHAGRALANETGEFAEIARALNGLLDERAAMVAQNSEQQQRLQNDIHQLATVATAAAAGDLSPRAKVQSGSLSKLADEVNATLDGAAQLAHGARTTSAALVDALAQCHALAEHLSQGVARQNSSFESNTTVLRNVAERTDSVSENAQVAGDASRRTTEAAQEGSRLLHRVAEGMLNVRRGAQGSATKVKRLGERATEISSIAAAISRISAQTNMLALNAAIEASRAGEHGLGFTVVADEVRKLAEDCEESTREIVRLIASIQSETSEAAAELERQAAQAEQQSQLAADAGGAFERIVTVSQQSAQLVGEISQKAHQQADDTTTLREAAQGAGQLAREMQGAADRALRTIEVLQHTAGELQRRAAAYRESGSGEMSPA